MPSKLLALLLFCLTTGAFAASEPPTGKPTGKRPAVVAKNAEPLNEDDLLPRTVFEVLLGEFALQRGRADLALGAYVDLARRSMHPEALARATEIATHARQFELALELARQWTRVDPESFKAQQALTTVLMLLNRTDELGDQLLVMLERDKPRLADNLLYLNRLLARLPDRQAVSRIVSKAAAPYHGIAEAHYAMGLAALSAGDSALARRESSLALELRPDWEMAILLRAQVLTKEAPDEARELLQTFIEAHPKAADARLSLARLLLSEKRYGEARRQFDLVLEDFPTSAEALYPAAVLALQQNDVVAGRQLLERLLSSNYPDKSAVHYFLGQIEDDAKNTVGALQHYRLVVAGDQFLPARSRAAQILAQQGQVDEAIRQLKETAPKTNEEKAQLAMAEASLLRSAKRPADAYAVLETALKAQPNHVELLYDAALMAERLGKKEMFETRLKRVLELKPEHAHALNALGYSWADQNIHLAEALQMISKALSLQPNDPFILDSLGWVQYRQNDLAKAVETLEKAFAIRPDPEIAAHLGEVLWVLGRREEAQKIWQESLTKNPDNEELLAVLKRYSVTKP